MEKGLESRRICVLNPVESTQLQRAHFLIRSLHDNMGWEHLFYRNEEMDSLHNSSEWVGADLAATEGVVYMLFPFTVWLAERALEFRARANLETKTTGQEYEFERSVFPWREASSAGEQRVCIARAHWAHQYNHLVSSYLEAGVVDWEGVLMMCYILIPILGRGQSTSRIVWWWISW